MTAPTHERNLTNGPVVKTLFLFALPSLGVNILQSLNGSVNSVWIGRFPAEEALAASANAGNDHVPDVFDIVRILIATTILIAQTLGRGNIEGVRRTMGSSLGMLWLAGVVTAITGWVFAPQLLQLLATPEEAYPLALTYFG